MKKIFLPLFLIALFCNYANAEEVKETKKKELSKEDDSSKKTLELQERLKKIQERGNKIDEEEKQMKEEKKQIQARKESLNKLEKTVNELNGILGIEK